MTPPKIIELTVYEVCEEAKDNWELIDHDVTQKIGKMDGFISRRVHQSAHNPTIFMDYVMWESLEHARQATLQVDEMIEFQPFFSIINEVKSIKRFLLIA